ncbi:ABC transporter permease [Thermoflavimicrobium dichotomicum]|uniref:ABC-2 type transport system permease protein n=1 Tax=Thermoflavimicrobium dichotomicum TaxID=46223 RepID=A0A1I3VFE6_9BACL|nr:ABC transporter permease [Thermoflavimicrobium dichotomicum]SFJ94088.1 ABC-2 type transport system permease protein [Thermoflavimicrobium dichotomicum]
MWKRIGALIIKEFIQLKRDRRTLAMMIMLPVIWLVAFGYAVNFDVDHFRIFIVDQAKNKDSREVIHEVEEHAEMNVVGQGTEKEARDALKYGKTDVAILFPQKYDSIAKSKEQQLNILVDGGRLFTAQSAVRKVNEVLGDIQKANMEELRQNIEERFKGNDVPNVKLELPADSPLVKMPPNVAKDLQNKIQSQIRTAMEEQMEEQKKQLEDQFPDPKYMAAEVEVLYNEDLKSAYYMIPGLMGLVLIFITTFMTALGVVREKERGTLEQLIVSPLRSVELILGKLLPYMIIATFDFLLVLMVGIGVFDVPFTGDLLSYLLMALIFLFASLGIGLFISTVSQNQQQAMQLAMMTLLPQFILSGFVFPLEAMPEWISWLSYLMPLTYFLPISRDVFLKGMSAWDHPVALAMLSFFAVLFLLVATVRFRRSLT